VVRSVGVVAERTVVGGRWQSTLVVIMRMVLMVRRVVRVVRVVRGMREPVMMVVTQITTHVRVSRPSRCRR
jgi:hypothetical protein